MVGGWTFFWEEIWRIPCRYVLVEKVIKTPMPMPDMTSVECEPRYIHNTGTAQSRTSCQRTKYIKGGQKATLAAAAGARRRYAGWGTRRTATREFGSQAGRKSRAGILQGKLSGQYPTTNNPANEVILLQNHSSTASSPALQLSKGQTVVPCPYCNTEESFWYNPTDRVP